MAYMAHVDGGRVPGTKQTTIAGIIEVDGQELLRYSEIGGTGSNTDAEFQSVLRCMELAVEHGLPSLHIKTDAKIVVEAFTTEFEVLALMLSGVDRDPENRGLFTAICKRTRQRFHSKRQMRNWLDRNRGKLERKSACPPAYEARLLALRNRLNVSIELIPRDDNKLANGLGRRARRKRKR